MAKSVKRYVATVQLLVDAEDSASASDGMSELLSHSGFVLDWGYLKLGGQRCIPSEVWVSDSESYEEGEFLV